MRLTKRIRKGLKGKGRRKTICGGKKTKRGGGKTPFLRNQAALKHQVDELNHNIASQVGDITDNKRLKSKYENMSLTELEDLLDELDFEDAQQTDENDVLIRLIIKQKKLVNKIAHGKIMGQKPY